MNNRNYNKIKESDKTKYMIYMYYTSVYILRVLGKYISREKEEKEKKKRLHHFHQWDERFK